MADDRNKGDDWYNDHPGYRWADEVGWIRESDGEVVEPHEGFVPRRVREAEEDWRREEMREARRNRRGW